MLLYLWSCFEWSAVHGLFCPGLFSFGCFSKSEWSYLAFPHCFELFHKFYEYFTIFLSLLVDLNFLSPIVPLFIFYLSCPLNVALFASIDALHRYTGPGLLLFWEARPASRVVPALLASRWTAINNLFKKLPMTIRKDPSGRILNIPLAIRTLIVGLPFCTLLMVMPLLQKVSPVTG